MENYLFSEKQTIKKTIKMLAGALFLAVLLTMGGAKETQAAMSRSKAIKLYNKSIAAWGKAGATTTITGDLRNNGVYGFPNIAGHKISMRSLYYGDDVRYIFKNIGGDSTVEAIFYSNDYIYIFNIQKNKVHLLSVLYGGGYVRPRFFYNSKKKTYSFQTMVTARSTSTKVYKIKNNRVYCYWTLGDYTEPTNSSGAAKKNCYINNSRVSSATYKKYVKTYGVGAAETHWGP